MGFGFWVLGFGFWVLGFRFWVWNLEFGLWVLGFRVLDRVLGGYREVAVGGPSSWLEILCVHRVMD